MTSTSAEEREVDSAAPRRRGLPLLWALLLLLCVEVVLVSIHYRCQTRRVLPPEVDLAGYPVETQRTVRQSRQRLLQADNVSAEEWDRFGDMLSAAGRFGEAEVSYRQAVQMQPEDPRFHYDLAFCLMSMGRLEAADFQFAVAAQLEPQLAAAQNYFAGINALRRNDADAARLKFELAARLPAAQLQLAIMDWSQEDFPGCAKHLQQVGHDSCRVRQLRADMLRNAGQSEEAYLLSLLAEDDRIVLGPWNERASMIVERTTAMSVTAQKTRELQRLRQGDADGVARRLKESQTLLWEPELEDLLADVAIARGDWKGHIEHLSELVRRDGASTYRMNRLGFALATTGQTKKGREALEIGYRLRGGAEPKVAADNCFALANLMDGIDPDNAAIYRAEYFRLMGDLERSLKLHEQQSGVWFRLGVRRYRSAIECPPDSSERQELIKNASDACQKCLAAEPNHSEARRLLALLKTFSARPE